MAKNYFMKWPKLFYEMAKIYFMKWQLIRKERKLSLNYDKKQNQTTRQLVYSSTCQLK